MNKKHLFATTGLVRGALGTVALTAAIVCASQGSAQAAAGTAASATIANMVKVDYFDASGKGLAGSTTTPITKSASTVVTVSLLQAAPTIGTPSPGLTATTDSGLVQTYTFKVSSNANGIDTYSFNVSGLTSVSALSWSDRYISGVTDSLGATTTYGSGTTSLNNIAIGAVTILSNTASTVTIPAGTELPNHIAANETVVINGVEYKVDHIAAGTVASVSSNTLTPEIPTVVYLNAIGGGVASIPGNVTGLTMSEELTVAVSVTATADPTQAKGTACFADTMASTSDTNKTITSPSACTDFTSSNLAITKKANVANGKPGEIIEYTVDVTLTGAKATSVKLTDAVPAYTTLVTYSDSYGGTVQTGTAANSDAFAQVKLDNGTTTSLYSLTVGSADNEGAAYGNVGAGDVKANGVANAYKDMTFYLGSGATSSTGGAVDATQHYTINYRVKIN